MSSTLPAALKRDVIDEATRPDGKVRCASCRKHFPRPHVQVDHIEPEWLAPDKAHDRDNLQVLCAPPSTRGCHAEKTAREARQRARRARRSEWSPLRLVAPAILTYSIVMALGFGVVALGGGDTGAFVSDIALGPYLWGMVGFLALLFALRPLTALVKWWLGAEARTPSKPAEPAVAPPPVDPSVRMKARIEAAAREAVKSTKGVVSVADLALDDSGRLLSFDVHYDDTGAPDHSGEWRVGFMEMITAKIDDGRWLATWQTGNDLVKIRRRPDLAARIPHPGFAADKPWYLIPVANEVTYDLRVTSHILVVGATLAGKTSLMRSIIESLLHAARHGDAQVWLGDPKLIELMAYRKREGVGRLATSDEDLWDLAIDTHAEMMRRYGMIEREEATEDDFPPLLVFIDEYEEYVRRMEDYFITSGKKTKAGMKCTAVQAMKSVLAMARKCRIHIVIGTQRPDSSWFGGAARDNLQGRACVGAATAELSRMCFGDSSYGRDVPMKLKGRTTFQIGDGKPVEDQAWWTPDARRLEFAGDDAILARLGQ